MRLGEGTMIEIDGAMGEGGGQVLRSSLSLSALLGIPCRIIRIRANRKQPGLRPQHLTAVRGVSAICGGRLEGDAIGSSSLTFVPGKVVPGRYVFDIGTAGASSLVLQAVLPPLVMTGGKSSVAVTGGTHLPLSPPYEYLETVFEPFLNMLGCHVRFRLRRCGFYPRGGGSISCTIDPLRRSLHPPLTTEKRAVLRAVSAVSRLPLSIAERQWGAARDLLGKREVHPEIVAVDAFSPGTYLFINKKGEYPTGFVALGARGKPAEVVGHEAAEAFLRHEETGAMLDPHLADQAVIYLALAAGETSFTTSCITSHLLTNLEVTRIFLSCRSIVEGEEGKPGRVTITGSGIAPFPS